MVVRRLEGRTIAEPVFPILVTTVSGAVAGFAAGYYNARARSEAHEARTVADAFAFVNHFIRHDLRNDLSAIRGHADPLAEADATAEPPVRPDSATIIGEKASEAMTRIETSGAVAETLVDDPALERVDLAAVTAELVDSAETTHGVPVRADLPDRAPVVANAGVRSVVDNPVENAVEHNDADDPRVHVAVELDGETARLTVRDNGPGIPDEQKESMFEDDSLEGASAWSRRSSSATTARYASRQPAARDGVRGRTPPQTVGRRRPGAGRHRPGRRLSDAARRTRGRLEPAFGARVRLLRVRSRWVGACDTITNVRGGSREQRGPSPPAPAGDGHRRHGDRHLRRRRRGELHGREGPDNARGRVGLHEELLR
jgi:hypothetical protein